MSKLLVIDLERFKEQLGCFSLAEPDGNLVEEDDIFSVLEDSKLDVIKFEAMVDIPLQYAIASKGHLDTIIHLITKDKIPVERYDKFQVFLVKPKKPEVSDVSSKL